MRRASLYKFLALPNKQVKDTHIRWFEANSRCNTRKQLEKEGLERDQAAEDDEEEQADLMDIDNLFTKKGQGPHMLKFEFVPVTDDPVEFISDRMGKANKVLDMEAQADGCGN